MIKPTTNEKMAGMTTGHEVGFKADRTIQRDNQTTELWPTSTIKTQILLIANTLRNL